HERIAPRRPGANRGDEVHRRGNQDEVADVEREIAGLRAVVAPARAQALAVEHDDRAEGDEHDRDRDLPDAIRTDRLVLLHAVSFLQMAETRRAPCRGPSGAYFAARKPASFMRL